MADTLKKVVYLSQLQFDSMTNKDVNTIYLTPNNFKGAVYIPSVTDDGILSWTNNEGLPNPSPVKIGNTTGPQGIQGPDEPQGIQGPKGDTGIQGPKGEKGDSAVSGIEYKGLYDPSANYNQRCRFL